MRSHDTYRAVRRTEWKELRKWYEGDFPWENFNTPAPKYHLGTLLAAPLSVPGSRSKYMPHIGKKERGRYLPAA